MGWVVNLFEARHDDFVWTLYKGTSIARHSPSSRSCPWQAAEAQASEVMEEKSGLAIKTSKWK